MRLLGMMDELLLPATPPFRLEQGNIFVSTLESFQGMQSSDREGR
jgi:hypothetical protein